MALALLFPSLFFLSLLFLILKRYKSTNVPALPPRPKPLPILGNLLCLWKNKPHVAMAQLAKLHGPLISLRLGTQITIVGSSSAAATEILKTHDRELSGRNIPDVLFAKKPELNWLAWTPYLTDEWKLLRALMRANLFAPKMIDNQSCIREKKIGEMLEFLGTKEGEVIQIRDAIFVYVFNSLGNYYFSEDFITFGGEEGKKVSKLVEEMMKLWVAPNISDMYPMLRFLDLQGLRKKTKECVRQLRLLWDGYIRDKVRGNNVGAGDHSDFLDVLIESGFSNEQISYIFVELFGAVSDTSTSIIEWAMTELIKNPKHMKKLQKKLDEAIPGRMLKESHLANLPYLHACVKETLRLHPPAPLLIPRRATKNCQLMNYTIPKDAHVLVNVWAIARDPTFWEDPLVFKPERFMINSEMDYKGNNFDYLPFGGGRRICAGMPMGIRQVQLGLASLLLNFEWSLPKNMLPHEVDMEESFSLTMMKEQPLELIAKRRK